MSKEKVNGVESTPIEKSKEGTEQVTSSVLEVSSAYNSPKTPRDVWNRVKVDFELQNFKTLKELSLRHGVDYHALRQKVYKGKWNEEQRTLQRKVMQKIEEKAVKEVSEADSYLKASFKRAVRFEGIAEACIAQAGTNADGIPLVEPDQLDAVTRSLVRLHELAKSSLRLPTVAMDITSNGQGLGESFISAIAKLRSEGQPKLSGEDLSKVLEAEVE